MPTESRFADGELRQRVRLRMQTGRLPVVRSTELTAGYGAGHPCIACGKPIHGNQIEYDAGTSSDGSRLSFHIRCHSFWQLECNLRLIREELTRDVIIRLREALLSLDQ